MIALLWFVLAILASPFKSKSRLEAENAALRHQLIVLRVFRLINTDKVFDTYCSLTRASALVQKFRDGFCGLSGAGNEKQMAVVDRHQAGVWNKPRQNPRVGEWYDWI